ncbi:MAG: hypothetical protein WC711_02225 [Candidatus Staskawiczbacteria bacterium]|jgi:hypothetical protein
MKNFLVLLGTPIVSAIIFYYALEYEYYILGYILSSLVVICGVTIILFPRRSKPICLAIPKSASEPAKVPMKCMEFVDAMWPVTEQFPNASVYLNDWYDGLLPAEWDTISSQQLDEKWLAKFVEDITDFFQKSIASADDELGQKLMLEGHAFILAIAVKCTLLELNVSSINFNPPLSPREAFAGATG